jgi:hypothetical protein
MTPSALIAKLMLALFAFTELYNFCMRVSDKHEENLYIMEKLTAPNLSVTPLSITVRADGQNE